MTIANGKNKVRFLENVSYVPEIRKNLLSVLSVQDRDQNSVLESVFKNCYLKNNCELLLHGIRNVGDGLFKAVLKNLVLETKVDGKMTSSDDSILKFYHERYGHQDKQHTKSTIERKLNV